MSKQFKKQKIVLSVSILGMLSTPLYFVNLFVIDLYFLTLFALKFLKVSFW